MHIISLGINVQNFILLESWWILLSFCQDGFSKMLPISQETPGYVLNGQFQNLPPQPSKAVGVPKTPPSEACKTTFLNRVDVYTVDMVYTDVWKIISILASLAIRSPDHTFERLSEKMLASFFFAQVYLQPTSIPTPFNCFLIGGDSPKDVKVASPTSPGSAFVQAA